MPPKLGKRKRVTREEIQQPSRSPPSPGPQQSDSEDGEDMRDAFRRAFEAKFKPLDVEPKKKKVKEIEEVEEESEAESDWSGIESADDNNDGVEVVEYADAAPVDEQEHRREMRSFMSSKPPSASTALSKSAPKKPTKEADDPTETAHLKNDLALQRLLRDSHLLSSTSTSGVSTPTLDATGASRHKSTDLHLLSLGAKGSIHMQKNMPMSHRKGMAVKAKHREDVRRREAKENGIILEKERRAKKFSGERDRGVGGPDVGTFKGGMLKLSKKDLADINGVKGSYRGKGGK
ncbi:hypothetical protein BU24DRAFT_330813, partial [Aaosphaeria arxii CBS 175.79]